MEDRRRLLHNPPGAGDPDIELQKHSQTHSEQNPTSRPQNKSYKVCYSISFFYFLAWAFVLGHFGFFQYLDGKPSEKTIRQNFQAPLANIFAVFVDIWLLAGLGVVYNQILWRLLRKKPFQAQVIDKLVHLHASPWEMGHSTIRHRHQLWALKTVIIAALACASIPFWLIFPPGGVETKFLNKSETTYKDVKTMNISDYGNGTIQQFVEHSLFEMNGDLNYNPSWSRPQLKAMAGQVLSSGEPVKFDSPCGSAYVYNISLEGPTFHCVESDAKPRNCTSHSPIYEAEDLVKDGAPGADGYALRNNAFQITWHPKPDPRGCDLESRSSLVCRMKLSTYTLQIEHALDASRSIKATVDNHRDVWTDQVWVQAQFYYYFYNSSGPNNSPRPQPIYPDELRTNFTKSQAFAIQQAAINALQGQVQLGIDAGALSFHGNASLVLGSPYIGLHDKYNPQFNISAENIERFLQDVVISTLSLGASTHNGDIKALEGTEVFCGFLCWRQNGSAAGNSFLQFATTTGSSNTLNELMELYPGGEEHASKKLMELELQVGVNGRFYTTGEGANDK
ncbi:hypothetical protein CEP54_009758 [Fusarium duplospermum]|uniref:Uncharacterized protein n=1 Tax=Fusarium duplospermum TaxID=1325734 RepID=A0A428PNT8_9HYPO|nr:hypothetical protein CEP54_009758 [Fusarium duplospermum]